MTEEIVYTDSHAGVTPDHLRGGFFAGWPNPPTAETHLRILHGSSAVGLAFGEDGNVVGFITAISDGVSCLYIPHLEVLSDYQGRGIGSRLVYTMLDAHRHLYMLDLMCEDNLTYYYKRLGMRPATGMIVRNYDRQHCGPT